MTQQSRISKGVPTGGQFGASAHAEADVALTGRSPHPTRQTSGPIRPLQLDISPRRAKGLADMVRDGDLDLAPPYQRGSVWTEDQRVELIRSFLTRTPIPAVVLNDRHTPAWHEANGTDPNTATGPTQVAIDGRQRIETVVAWYDDQVAVPASWFTADSVVETVPTDDGPYVTWSGLSRPAQLDFNQDATLPVAAGRLATVEEEAAMYLRVNGAGTAQSDDDMANAARIANQGDTR